MKPGPFIKAFSALARIEENTLRVHARTLRDAGILKKSGRGNSAIEVDNEYLAALLISRMATDRPSHAVEAYRRFADMQLLNESDHYMVESVIQKPDHTLSEFMVAICDPALSLNRAYDFTVTFLGDAIVDVSLQGCTMTYCKRDELATHTAMISTSRGDSEKEALAKASIFHSQSSLQGIIESRQFSSTWLELVKDAILRESGSTNAEASQ